MHTIDGHIVNLNIQFHRGFYKIPSGVMFAEVDNNPNKILLQTTTNLDIQASQTCVIHF